MEPLLNQLIKAIGWSILNSLWQGALIYGLLLFITMAMPKLQPKMKHNLAFAAICLIFICFCVTFFSVFKYPVGLNAVGANKTALITAYGHYVSSVPQQISQKAEYILPQLVGIYSLGLAIQLLILGLGYKRMVSLKKGIHLEVPSEWNVTFKKLITDLNLRRKIGFYLSDKVNVPLVIGYFKPLVLFPVSLASQLDMDQVEAILIHELSHIRRNDYLLNLIKTGIETLLFFNPFIWLSGRFINIEREHACDDLVLKFTGNPMTYAHALLKLEILKDKSAPAFSMPATGKNQHLYQRIKRITDMKTNYMNVRQHLFTITLAITTVILLAWVKPSKAEKTNTKIIHRKHTEVTVSSRVKRLSTPEVKQVPLPVIHSETCSDLKIPGPKMPPTPAAPPSPTAAIPVISPVNYSRQDTVKKHKRHTIISFDDKRNMAHTYIDSIVSNSLSFLKSPEWKKSLTEITASAKVVKPYLDGKEGKKYREEIRKHAEMIRKNSENLREHFDSKEWKQEQKNLQKLARELADETRQLLKEIAVEKREKE